MDEDPSDAGRAAEFISPLGKNKLLLTAFSGTEGLSQLFEYQVLVQSTDRNVQFDNAIGKGCTIKLNTSDGKKRFFHGILTEAKWTGSDYLPEGDKLHFYRVVLRPWLWLLGHRADCRIFLGKTVKDIIKDVFSTAGFTDVADRTTDTYENIEYCVQYHETDLAFVSRLMEHSGIYYFFEPSEDKHTLVLADGYSSLKPIEDLRQVSYVDAEMKDRRGRQRLWGWSWGRCFRTGKIQFNDYDYTNPNKDLKARKEAAEKYAHSKLEIYECYPNYDDKGKGEKLAQFRLEAEQALDHRRSGVGDAVSLYPGGLVTFEKHPTSSENQEYLVVQTRLLFSAQQYRAGQEFPGELRRYLDLLRDDFWQHELLVWTAERSGDALPTGSDGYFCDHVFQPSNRPFRSLPLTPKPRIYGIHTAKVVAKKGEEGAEISTDKYGRIWVQFYWDREPQKSCPVRVAQVWAGQQWGAIFIPRVGMEAVVDYVEGDPDRPLVVGCVYNGDNTPPYDLPDNKTMAGLKSNSSQGGNGFNEFVFEDAKGKEKVRMHAEKDHEVVIRDTETVTIGEAFTGQNGSASRNWTLKQGDDKLEVAAGKQDVHIAQTQTINVDQDITITSFTSITLKVGSNQVVIDQSGVHITAMTIDLHGNALIEQKCAMITIN